MTRCPKCNKELRDGTKFCDSCGTPIFETVFCPNCGKKTSTEFAFCGNCGASIAEAPMEGQAEAASETLKTKKRLPKKALIFGAIGVAVIAVVIVIISLFCGGKAENNVALYIKDREIFFSDLKKDSEAWQLTSRLVDADGVDEEDLAEVNFYLGLFTYRSEDGKYIFFPDKVGDDDEGISIYYREDGKPEEEAIKMDSDVRSYTVNKSATLVTYLKGEEGNLYQYNIREDSKDKIASEVEEFEVSDNGKKIWYTNSEGCLYLKYAGKDKEKIASDVSSLVYLTKDFAAAYYIKDGSLYKQVEGEEKVKITSDLYEVIKIYDSGEIYYLKGEPEELSLMEFVTDDMKAADDLITEPEYPDVSDSPEYPYWWEYDTDEEYDAAVAQYEADYAAWEAEYDRVMGEYYAADDAYDEKMRRDSLRESLAEETIERDSYSLCYYNGTEETVITDAFAGGYSYDYTAAVEAAVIAYKAYDQAEIEKVKLSEVESTYDIKDMVEDAMFSSSERYIAVKNTATLVEQHEDAMNFEISADGTIVYYIDDVSEEYGELYRIDIKDGVVGKAELYDSDVYTGHCYFVSRSNLEYFKEYKDSKGELYIDKVKIDDDVNPYRLASDDDLDELFYFTDWNDEKECGTLKVYQDGEAVKIADDVHDYSVTDDGRALYLYDYSLKYDKGELHEWENGETRKIDDDVVCIITVYENKYRGYTYVW